MAVVTVNFVLFYWLCVINTSDDHCEKINSNCKRLHQLSVGYVKRTRLVMSKERGHVHSCVCITIAHSLLQLHTPILWLLVFIKIFINNWNIYTFIKSILQAKSTHIVFHISKLNILKIVHDLCSQRLTKTLPKTSIFLQHPKRWVV
jgi:hypothetical protein